MLHFRAYNCVWSVSVCSGNSRVSTEPLSRKRWGGSRQVLGGAWVLALDTCYTVENRRLLYGFALSDKRSPSHHKTAFDLNVVENSSRGGIPNHITMCLETVVSTAWETQCLLKMQAPRPPLMQVWISQTLQKNQVQWWEPSSCRHLAVGRDNNISVLWESLLSSCENTGSGMENEPAPHEENTGSLVFHDGSSGMKVPFNKTVSSLKIRNSGNGFNLP